MPARLLYRDAQGREAFVDISESNPLYLGRGVDCAVRTEDAMVSRKNTKVSFVAGRYYAEDLQSANGTYVNEKRVQKQQLTHADIIRCGSLQVRYVEVAAPAVHQTPLVQSAIQDEPGPEAGAIAAERDALKKQLDDLKPELEALRGKMEAADTELKRLRAEVVANRDELNKIKRDAAQDKEELHAVGRAHEEQRKALTVAKDEAATLKTRVEEMTEELAARDRQLERAQEDVQRTKKTVEELRNKLGELQKTKDEGWGELNKQLAQVDHLREVIAEQERILEERRVGLISLESAAKDVRAEKEKVLRELVDTRNARDELKDKLARAEARVEGLEEEHRRLARAMNEGVTSSDELSRIGDELRNLKVDHKKLQTDLERAQENLARAEQDRQKLSDASASGDVERGQLVEDKKAAEAARARAEEARAKAESLRQRADEDKLAASAARDAALATADDLKRSLERADKKIVELTRASGDAVELQRALDKASRRVAELEEGAAAAPVALAAVTPAGEGGEDAARHHAELAAARKRAEEAEAEVARQAEELQHLNAEVVRLGEELAAAPPRVDITSEMAAVTAPASPPDEAAAAPGADAAAEIRMRAQEVYDGINSALSELRTTIITAKGLFGEVGPRIDDEDARKALGDALGDSMDRTEDAKGLLRSLKELAQG